MNTKNLSFKAMTLSLLMLSTGAMTFGAQDIKPTPEEVGPHGPTKEQKANKALLESYLIRQCHLTDKCNLYLPYTWYEDSKGIPEIVYYLPSELNSTAKKIDPAKIRKINGLLWAEFKDVAASEVDSGCKSRGFHGSDKDAVNKLLWIASNNPKFYHLNPDKDAFKFTLNLCKKN